MSPRPAKAVEHNTEKAWELNLENDSAGIGGPGTDRAYTNGFRFSYVFADDEIPQWAQSASDRSKFIKNEIAESTSNFAFSIAQQMFTPNNTLSTSLIPNDRPYAAWLYLGLSADFQTDNHSDIIEFDVGVIGPEAYGERVQNGVHQLAGAQLTQGWRNQLGTEPTLQLFVQQRRLLFKLAGITGRKYLDVIPYYGGALGNVAINAHVGGLLRFGLRLPDDFGPTGASSADGVSFISPAQCRMKAVSIYGFGGARGIAVARNIFLDGNTFRDSPHVSKNNFVSETELGVGSFINQWTLVWRLVTRSPEFKEKSETNSFASITIAYAF